MKLRAVTVLSLLLLAACSEKKPEAPSHRAELRQLTGNTLELIPTAGQLPYCLVYTLSEKGVIRQLTMNPQNRSIPCPADQPIKGVAFRIPVAEGPVRVLVFFSDQQLHAGSINDQLYELYATNPHFSALDLRLPGKVNTEVLPFTPSAEMPTQVGTVVGPGDAGPPSP